MIDEISGDFLQWLRGFYFVAKQGSVRQAAIAMGREKSTVSRQIQCLEEDLGVALFDRSSGRMRITPEGEILQEQAVALFEDVKRIRGGFKNKEINYRGMILIASTPAVIDTILPPYIEHFQRLHPEVTFKFEGGPRERVYEKVESSEADFGIAFCDTGRKALVCHPLYEAGLVMIVPKNKPYFSGKALPTLEQIADVPLILFSQWGFQEPWIEERFAKDRLKPNVVMAHNNFVAIKKYVALGMGVAILGRIAISQEDEQNFDTYSLDKYFPKKKYGVLLKKKKFLSETVKAFIRTIKPDIDFSPNLKPSDAPTLSLIEFLRRVRLMNQTDAPMVKVSRIKSAEPATGVVTARFPRHPGVAAIRGKVKLRPGKVLGTPRA
jgi:DNA-binding transcriptional LysR family regulator